jgi:ATP-dependent Clp protease ATP-binding subunit ClpA
MHRATPFMNAAGSASRLLGHDYIATEHLLLALSQDRGSATARMLARDGLSTDEIRSEIFTLIGVCDSPRGQMDGDALATLGIDIDQVRRQAERAFGQDALERAWMGCTPVAPRLKRALELAVREAGDTPLFAEHVLLGLASVEGSVAARILAAHGITATKLRAALRGERPSQQTD